LRLELSRLAVCSVLKPAFGHDTLHKLQEKTPVGSVVFDKQFWPTTDALDEMCRHDEWLNMQEHSFSMKKIGQYFRTCKPLSAQDADGWRGREHVGWLFSDGNFALQELLRTHLILPNILGDFLAEHLDEIAGVRIFALEKANNSLRPIVIGSLWRRCAARLGVAEVRNNVVTFFMSQYTNFIQFGGKSDGATRCGQVTQLLAARHATCTGAAICDDVFIDAPLVEGLALAAELKQVLK